MAQMILYFIVAFIFLEFSFEKILSYLNLKTWSKPLPQEVKDLYEPEKYTQAKEYAIANFKTGTVSSVFSLLISISFLWFKGFAWVDEFARSLSAYPVAQALLFFGIIGAASWLISLPFEIYETFAVEEKFGFNKTTPKLFKSSVYVPCSTQMAPFTCNR